MRPGATVHLRPAKCEDRGMSLPADITDERIAVLVDRFYAKIRRDPWLGPVFEAAVEDWPEHLALLTDFWSSVMLTSGRYKGRPMEKHMRLPIEPAMFDRWLELWGETVGEMFAPEAADEFRLKAHRIGESLKAGLFFDPAAIDPALRGRGRP